MTVFPARAGMSPIRRRPSRRCAGVPRASGDEPTFLAVSSRGRVCSPRERG